LTFIFHKLLKISNKESSLLKFCIHLQMSARKMEWYFPHDQKSSIDDIIGLCKKNRFLLVVFSYFNVE
jgi:hypothetical protein